jgi:uncharacterized protein YbaP (TraB family)
MWKVIGAHATVYIFGIVPPSMVGDVKWKSPALEQATAAAQELWFEAPLGLPGPITAIRLMSTLTTQGALPAGQTLSSLLSPEDAARLRRVAAKSGVSMDKLDRMKPWRADVELALARKEGTLKPGAVEQYVISASRSAPRHGFDNMEDDLKAIVTAPQKEQIANLARALGRYEDPAENHRYAEAWSSGDLGWIEKNRVEPLKSDAPTIFQRMRVDRPRRWADQIARLADEDTSALVLVEVANLVGPNGLPSVLRKRGLKVEGP